MWLRVDIRRFFECIQLTFWHAKHVPVIKPKNLEPRCCLYMYVCTGVCICVCLCVCVCAVSQQWSNQVAISMHLWWRHPFGKCVSSLHICMQEREFTLYQCGVTQDDQEHCNCAWLPLPTPSRLQVRAGFSLLSPFLLFCTLNVLYLPKPSSERL